MGELLTFRLGGTCREGRIGDRDDALRYLFAGRASFTLVSGRTDRRLAYSIRAFDGSPDRFIVWARGDAIGFIDRKGRLAGRPSGDGLSPQLAMSLGWRDVNDVGAKAIGWFLRRLVDVAVMPSDIALIHDGRCGRCRALLTTRWAAARGVDQDCAAVLPPLIGREAG